MLILKLALRPFNAAPISQTLAIVTVGFLLFLVGFLTWIDHCLDPVVERLEREQVLVAYLNPTIQEPEKKDIADSIRVHLGASAVRDIKIESVGTQKFLDQLRGSYPALAREIVALGAETAEIIPQFFTISGILPPHAFKKIQKIPGIESVENSEKKFRPVVGAFQAIQWLSRAMVIGLGIVLVTGFIFLSRINAQSQAETLALLKLWGTDGYLVRLPGAITGGLIGFAGGFLAAVVWINIGAWLGQTVVEFSPVFSQFEFNAWGTALFLLIIGTFSGILAGFMIGGSEEPSTA